MVDLFRGINPSALIADSSQLSQGIGSLINQTLANRVAKQIEGDGITREDMPDIAKLAQRDPARARAIGSILESNEQQAATQKDEAFQIGGRVAQFLAGSKNINEQTINSAIGSLSQFSGNPMVDRMIQELEADKGRIATEGPEVLRQEYQADLVASGGNQTKVGARRIFTDGTILQSTPQGPRVFSPSGEQLTGEAARAQLEEARKTEIALAGGKAGAAEQAKTDVKLGSAQDLAAKAVRGKSQESREQGFIDSGVEAADSMANITRAIELLDLVETGGFDAAQLRASQLLGIESADEGELAEALGVAVLSQLKPIFGSAFTAQEGERLERLSAGFGKSPAANKRILEKQLEIAKRASKRAIRAAEKGGDEFTADEIRQAMSRAESALDKANDTPETGQGQPVIEVDF